MKIFQHLKNKIRQAEIDEKNKSEVENRFREIACSNCQHLYELTGWDEMECMTCKYALELSDIKFKQRKNK